MFRLVRLLVVVVPSAGYNVLRALRITCSGGAVFVVTVVKHFRQVRVVLLFASRISCAVWRWQRGQKRWVCFLTAASSFELRRWSR